MRGNCARPRTHNKQDKDAHGEVAKESFIARSLQDPVKGSARRLYPADVSRHAPHKSRSMWHEGRKAMNKRFPLTNLFLLVFLFLFASCENSTGPSPVQVTAPSRTDSARDILAAQGIQTIHFLEYDSVVVNGQSQGPFSLSQEIFLDTSRVKIVDAGSTVATYDLKKGVAWNYENGQLTYMQLPDLQAAYNGIVQALMGSGLRQPVRFLRNEELDGKLCSVFEDSTGLQEWIWNLYKLPIQRKTSGSSDANVYVTSIVQRRDIQINVPLSDSIFAAP